MQITLTITEGFSCADELAVFAAKLQEMFAGVMRPAAKPVIGAVSTPKESKLDATPKQVEPLKRAADVTVEPRDVTPVDVEAKRPWNEVADEVVAGRIAKFAEGATQEPTAGTDCDEPKKKRNRRTKDQIAADDAAAAEAKRAAEAAMIAEAKAPAPVAAKPAAEVTEADVMAAFGDLVDLEDGEVSFGKIMARYGVAKISKLIPSQYASVHADIIIEIGRLSRAAEPKAEAPKSAKFAL